MRIIRLTSFHVTNNRSSFSSLEPSSVSLSNARILNLMVSGMAARFSATISRKAERIESRPRASAIFCSAGLACISCGCIAASDRSCMKSRRSSKAFTFSAKILRARSSLPSSWMTSFSRIDSMCSGFSAASKSATRRSRMLSSCCLSVRGGAVCVTIC